MNIYGNLALKEIPEFEHENVKANTPKETSGTCANANEASRVAKDCLQVVSTKFLSAEIGVSQRLIQAWASGEREIPHHRTVQIIVRSKGYFLNLSKIETEVDRMILKQFGKGAI